MGLLTQLIAQKHQEKMQQALYKAETQRALMMDPNARPEFRQQAFEELTKQAPPEAEGLVQHIGKALFGGPPKPKLSVPQLIPPPGQEGQDQSQMPSSQSASYGPSAGGGIQMPPPPPGMVSGPPPPPPQQQQQASPWFSPSEAAVRGVQAQAAGAQAMMPLQQQQLELAMNRLKTMNIDPSKLDPQQISDYVTTGKIPYAPFNKLSEGETGFQGGNVIHGAPKPITVGPGQKVVVPPAPGQPAPPLSGQLGGMQIAPSLTPPPGAAQTPQFQTVAEGGPPLLAPEMRAAVAAYAKAHNQDPASVDLEKAQAWWHEFSDPVGSQLKKGQLAMLPLEEQAKRSTIATQAVQRQTAQSELDLANDPEVVGYLADQYRLTKQMPALGMRSTVMRSAILKDAAQKALAAGSTGEADAIRQQAFKADSAALTDITRQQNRISQFEKTAGKNLDLFMSQAKRLVDSGSPLINRPLRDIQRTIAGDPKMAAFEAARTTAFTEVSRVLSGTMGQQLSDTARKEANSILSGNYTIPQMMAAVGVLKADMKNRMDALGSQVSDIKSGMGGKSSAPSLTPPPNGLPTITTKQQFDALPKGAHFMEDGKELIKQ